MNPEATIGARVWIREDVLSVNDTAIVRKDLLIHPTDFGYDKPESINLLVEEDGWLGLPIYYGLKTFQKAKGFPNLASASYAVARDQSDGESIAGKIPKRPTPRDAEQADFFNRLSEQARVRPVVLTQAPTGSGKTVGGIYAIAELDRSALVVVPTKRIARQWRDTCYKLFGMAKEDVGVIEGGKFDYEGKAITIAVIHNLALRDVDELPEGFENAFGTVLWDEAHNLGARAFSRTMGQVNARHRIAMTATPKRRDGTEKVFLYYFGAPCVRHTGEALEAVARVFDYHWQPIPGEDDLKKVNALPRAILLKVICASGKRNRMVADKVAKMQAAGRQILVVSEQIYHLQSLMDYCSQAGIPDEVMGLYARSYSDEEGKRKTMKEEQLDWVAENSQVIFATYGMAKEGLDIPRLDAGIDVTPRSEGTQVIGRIRRPLPGKPTPLWITIRDRGIYSLERATEKRLRDYRGSNTTVKDHGKAKN